MNSGVVTKVLGTLLLIEALILAIPLLVAVFYGEPAAVAFAWSVVITAVSGAVLRLIVVNPEAQKPNANTIKAREGLLIVTLGWVLASLFGALPFFFAQAVPTFADAFFESVSGLTTTGATVIDNVENLPRSILFWRSFSHWIGGMGILVFTLAVLPALGIGGMQIFKAESPGPTADKLVPRLANTAKLLYTVYLGITISGTFVLRLSGLPIFESLTLSLGTVGTGGFSSFNNSISALSDNVLAIWAIAVLMILSGVNFGLYYELWQRRWHVLRVNTELKWYLAIIGVSSLLIAMNVYHASGGELLEHVRHAVFQVGSIITTTGYFSVDFNRWPAFSKGILALLMFIGGSAGSAAGGMKVIRVVTAVKLIRREINQILHTHALVPITVNGWVVPQETVSAIAAFLLLYVAIFGGSTLLISLAGYDLSSAAITASATLNNVGLGLGIVGPGHSFSCFSSSLKVFLSVLMLLGRLELFTMLVIVTPGFWRQ